MRAPLSWLREHTDLPAEATAEDVQAVLVRVGLEEEEDFQLGHGDDVVANELTDLIIDGV